MAKAKVTVVEELPENMLRRGGANGIIYTRTKEDGKDVWKSTKCRDVASAKIRQAEILLERRDKNLGWVKKVKAVVPTVLAYTKLYLKLYSPRKKKNSAESDRVALIRWQTLYGDRKLDTLIKSDFMAYQEWRLGGPRPDENQRREEDGPAGSANTVLHELAVMHTVLNAAIGDGILTKNPMWKLKKVDAVTRSRVLSSDEQVALFAKLSPEYQRLATVFLGTGLRANELLKLEVGDVNFDEGYIDLPAKKAKGGKKGRLIPMYPEVVTALKQQIKARETGQLTVIQRPGGCKRKNQTAMFNMGRESALSMFHDKAAEAGIEDEFTIHDLRRTFGTRCAEAGCPIKHLSDVMGHSDIAITAKYYIHIGKDSLKKTLLALDLGLTPKVKTPKVVNFEKKR